MPFALSFQPKSKIKGKSERRLPHSSLNKLVFIGFMVRPERVELPTFWFVVREVNLVSYDLSCPYNFS